MPGKPTSSAHDLRPRRCIRIIGALLMITLSMSWLGCRKQDDSASGGSGSSANTDSTANPAVVVQPNGVSQILAFSALPALDNGGRLVAAIHCDPKEFEAHDGVTVIWSFTNTSHPPDSALWIITLDPRSKTWLSTGDVAIVSSTGSEALGMVYRPGDYALADVPVATPQPPHYTTEWVWLLWSYDRKLDDLARSITEKHRSALQIPAGNYVAAAQWLKNSPNLELSVGAETNGMPSGKPPILVHDTAGLADARREFAAGKSVLDRAFVEAFGNWSQAASMPGVEAVAAIWQGAIDLRLLHGQEFDGAAARNARPVFRKDLCDAVRPAIVQAASDWARRQGDDRFAAVLADYMARSTSDPATAQSIGASTEKVQHWLVTAVQNFFAGDGREADLSRLIEALTLWGDARIDQLAYPNRPPPPGAGGADYRNLAASPQDGYFTGYAIKWDQESVLDKRFGTKQTTAKIPGALRRYGDCTLKLSDMRRLASNGTVDVTDIVDKVSTTLPLKSRWIVNYGELRRQLDEMEKQVKQHGDEGERAWLGQVAGDNKAQAAAAIRLLMYDLRTFLTRTTGATPEMRDIAIERLTLSLLREAPKPAQPYVKPFAAMLHFYSKEYVDYLWPSHIPELLDTLDNRSIRSALALLPPPQIKTIFPDRDRDVDKALSMENRSVPHSASNPTTAP